MTRLNDNLRGHLAMLCFSALIAGSFSLGSRSASFIDPGALNAARFALAAAITGSMALATRAKWKGAYQAPWRFAVLGLLLALYFVLMFEGLKTAAPVSAASVFTLTPLMAAGFGWLLMRQRMTGRMAFALVLGGIGALWVIFRADWQALLAFNVGRGEFIYFWGCAAHALYTPMIRYLNRGEPAIVFTFAIMSAGCLILTGWSWPAIAATDWTSLPAIVWITLVYVAVFASGVTFLLLQYASMRLPAAKVMAYTYLTPSWVLLWELALARTVPPLMVLIGMGITLVALWLLLEDSAAKVSPSKP